MSRVTGNIMEFNCRRLGFFTCAVDKSRLSSIGMVDLSKPPLVVGVIHKRTIGQDDSGDHPDTRLLHRIVVKSGFATMRVGDGIQLPLTLWRYLYQLLIDPLIAPFVVQFITVLIPICKLSQPTTKGRPLRESNNLSFENIATVNSHIVDLPSEKTKSSCVSGACAYYPV